MNQKDRHNYEYDVDVEGPSAPARVVRMVGKNKRVLEIGAGPGSITKHLVQAGDCEVTALEIDNDAIKKLSQYTNKIYPADLNEGSWPKLLVEDSPFEVIVAGDVLEHLYDPWNTLSLMKDLLTTEGYIVISLPHVGHNAIVACLLSEDFQYRDWGLLDRTHIRFFGLKNMQQLFDDAGLKIIDAQFVITPPEDSEFSDKWSQLPNEVKKVLSGHQHGQVYQVVIKAISREQEGDAIDLMKIPVDGFTERNITDQGVSLVKRIARKYLSEKTRQQILGCLRKK